jgi:hypothetical protein
MAKHKKHLKKSTKHRRRHYIGAVPNQMLTPILMIGGGVLGKYLTNKFMPQQNDTIKGAVLVGTGILASNYAKNSMVQAAGNGLIVAGGLTIVKSIKPALFGTTDDVLVISGNDIAEVNGMDEINGIDELGATNDIAEVNGVDQIGGEDDFNF